MKPVDTSPAFTVTREMSGEDGQIKDISKAFEPYLANLLIAGKELIDSGETKESDIA
jgi:hypothetical protein